MGNRSLLSLVLVALSLSMFALVAPVQAQDGGMQMQLLLPLPNNPISTAAFPVAVQFVNPIDAQVNHYEATIDGRRFIKGDVNLSKIQPGQSYSFRIDGDLSVYTPLLAPGMHIFNIRLSDSRGRSVERQVNFYLQTAIVPKSIVPPTVRIISPLNGAEIKGPVNIKVEASGATGIKYITIFINDVAYGITSEYPYTVSWDPIKAKMTSGSYTISASAIDLSDNKAVSPTVVVKLADQGNYTNFNAMYPLTKSARLNDNLGIVHPAIPSVVNDLPFAYKSEYSVPMVAYGLSARSSVQTPGIMRDLIALIPISNTPNANVIANSAPLQAYGLTTPMALAYKAGCIAPMTLNSVYIAMRNPIVIPAVNTGEAIADMPAIGSPADATSIKSGRAYPVLTSIPNGISESAPATQSTPPMLNGSNSMMVILPASSVAFPGITPASMPNLQDKNIAAHQSISTGNPNSVTLVDLPVVRPANVAAEKNKIINAAATRSQNIKPSDLTTNAQLSPIDSGTTNIASSYAVPASPAIVTSNKTIPAGNPKHNATVTLPAVNPQNGLPARDTDATGTPAKVRNISPGVPSSPLLVASANIGSGNSRIYAVPTSPVASSSSNSNAIAPEVGMVKRDRLQTSNNESYTIKGYLINDRARGISPTLLGRNDAPAFFNNALNFMRPSSLSLASLPAIGGAGNSYIDAPGASVSNNYLPRSFQPSNTNDREIFVSVPTIPVENTSAVPTIKAQSSYIIKTGDTLNIIADAYHTSPVELQQMNPGIDFVPGNEIIVPIANARIFVDNKSVITNSAYYPSPYMVNNVAMVPMRMLVEAKGGVVVWLEKDMSVNAWSNGSFVDLKIGTTVATVNNDSIDLSRAAHIVADRTMVPLSFLAQTLNMEASYNATSGTYALISKK